MVFARAHRPVPATPTGWRVRRPGGAGVREPRPGANGHSQRAVGEIAAPGEMWGNLLDAFALLLVLEGIMPFLSPSSVRRLVARLNELGDGALRIAGLASMLVGVVLLYLGG